MARRTLPLNNLSIKKAIRTAKTENKTAKSFDGGGLFLLVDKSGNTGWRFKYRINDKEKLISFGVYPDISLSDARKQRSGARELIAKGIDPSLSRKLQKTERSKHLPVRRRRMALETKRPGRHYPQPDSALTEP